jgi:hypothetical protein
MFDDKLVEAVFGGRSGNEFVNSFVKVFGKQAGTIADSLAGSTDRWPTNEASELLAKVCHLWFV